MRTLLNRQPLGTPNPRSPLVTPKRPDRPVGSHAQNGVPAWDFADVAVHAPSAAAVVPTTSRENRLKFWINAFIPRDAEGALTVASGKYTGRTMLPGPTDISDCFLTDNRSFSDDVTASSRLHSEYEFAFSEGNTRDVKQSSSCGTTHELDCEDGDLECEATAKVTPQTVFSPIQLLGGNPDRPYFTLEAEAGNPCFAGAPAINYQGAVSFDVAARVVVFHIFVDEYPAYEAYARIDSGAPLPLIQENPPAGNSPRHLYGLANRPFKGIHRW